MGIAGGQRFSLSKRYREFLELHQNLAGFYPQLSLPSVASVSPCCLHCLSGMRGPLREEPPLLQHLEHACHLRSRAGARCVARILSLDHTEQCPCLPVPLSTEGDLRAS